MYTLVQGALVQDTIAHDAAQQLQHKQPIQHNKLATLIEQQARAPPAPLNAFYLPAGPAVLAAWGSLVADKRFKADMRAAGLSVVTAKVVLDFGGAELPDLLVGGNKGQAGGRALAG